MDADLASRNSERTVSRTGALGDGHVPGPLLIIAIAGSCSLVIASRSPPPRPALSPRSRGRRQLPGEVRQLAGLVPYRALNAREKCDGSLKPTRRAMSAIVGASWPGRLSSMVRARSSRRS